MFSIFPFIGVSWQNALFKSIDCICFPITCKEPSRLHLDEMSQSTSEELCYKSQTAAALVQKTHPWCGWYQFSIFDYSIKYTWFFPGSCRLFRTYFHIFPKNRRKTLHERLEKFWNSLQQVLSMIASKSHWFSARQLWQRLCCLLDGVFDLPLASLYCFPDLHYLTSFFYIIGTEGALRTPMTYDNHPIHPIPSIKPL